MPHERIFKLFRQHSLTNVYDFEEHVKLGEALEVCAHCGHIHLGIKADDDDGKVCGHTLNLKQQTIDGAGPNGFTGQESKEPQSEEPSGRSLRDGLSTAPSPVTCQCPRYNSALPKKFMLLQPQSWHPEVWTDITRMLSLNSAQSAAGRQMHLCPMQFDIADRVIAQYSMPGEVVYDPFAGIGTVPMRAVRLGRFGRGCELSAQYFTDAVYYCESAEKKLSTPTLFDMTEAQEESEDVPA